jgi:PAS domain S-box-containing protein
MEITSKQRVRLQALAAQFLLGIAGLGLISFVCFQLGFGLARTAFAYVIVIALASQLGSFSVSVVLSIIAVACLDYFFAPPLFALGVDVSDDIVRIAAFLITALIVTALTARLKRGREALSESKAKLEATQRVAHVGWWERDLSTGHVSLSEEVRSIFGVQPVDLPQWQARWLELIHPEDRARVTDVAASALVRGGPRYDVEYRVVRPDGTVRAVRSQGDVTWDDAGRPLRQFGVLQDVTELRQAEQEVRASEERFRALTQFSFDVYWESDAQHRFIRQEFAEGLSDAPAPESEIGKTRWEVPYLEPDAEAWRKHRETLDAHLPFRDFELARPTTDGGKRYVSVSGLPVFDDTGRFVGYRGVGRHITERKRAEAALRASEERFRTLVQFSFDLYWETDAEHCFVRLELAKELADAGVLRDAIGKTPWETPYLEPDAEVWRKQREVFDAHLPFRDFELARPTADGGRFYESVYGLPVFDETGRFVGYRGVGRNITERKRAEEALRRSEAYLAEAERLNHSGAFAFNAKESLYWSEGIYRLWGIDPQQGIPSREAWLQRVHPDDRNRAYDELQDALRQKRDYAIEYRLLFPDGSLKHVRSIGHPSYSAAGELLEVVGTTLDVTERKRAQEEHERLRLLEMDLAHLNRLGIMGELTASLAHEILHPIATARNNARAGMRFLERSPPNLDEVREALACVVRDADRGKAIVDRIRDQIKKAPPQKVRFDLNEAINEVIGMVRNAIDRTRVSVRTSLIEHAAPVLGDRVQLQQVVLNLVLNAVEAMSSVDEGARELSISTELTETSGILIAVRDSGPGIDPEQLDRLFKPFYTTKSGGIGMGLSICRSIVDAHGGKLWAEPNSPRGAAFRFTLPMNSQTS